MRSEPPGIKRGSSKRARAPAASYACLPSLACCRCAAGAGGLATRAQRGAAGGGSTGSRDGASRLVRTELGCRCRCCALRGCLAAPAKRTATLGAAETRARLKHHISRRGLPVRTRAIALTAGAPAGTAAAIWHLLLHGWRRRRSGGYINSREWRRLAHAQAGGARRCWAVSSSRERRRG